MEVLHKTQFAEFEKDFNKLPAFLQKKFQEAIATEAKKADAESLVKKLEKAEQRRNEQKEKLQLKKLQERINFEDTVARGRQAQDTRRELITQIRVQKQTQADQVYGDQLAQKIHKGHTLGAKKVQEAREAREAKIEEAERERQRKRNERIVLSYPNASLDVKKMEKHSKLIEKHYTILKKLNLRGYHSQRATLKKQEAIELKLAKAASRHQEILEEKKAKAIRAAARKEYPKEITLPLEARVQSKQEGAEARRAEILQQKIDRARASYALSKKSTDSQSGTSSKDEEGLKTAQKELSTCYEIINAQKAANFKLLEELNQLKKANQELKKHESATKQKAYAWVIDGKVPSFAAPKGKEATAQTEDSEGQSWTML